MKTVTVHRTVIGNRAAAQLWKTERNLINVARQNGSSQGRDDGGIAGRSGMGPTGRSREEGGGLMATATPTTAVYARISKDRTGEREGTDRQVEDCTKFATKQGWKLAGEPFIDDDISASKYTRKKRPAYTRLIEQVADGRITRIVAWKLDRLWRVPRELEDLIKLAEGGVEIVTVMGGVANLNTSAGRTNARIGVAIAAGSSDDTSERIVRQKAQRRAEGKPAGGPPAFGWKRVGPEKDRRLVKDPAQAKVLVAAMDAVLAGTSLSDIARRWNKAKVRGRHTWDANNVAKVLTRPLHAGLLIHRGAVLATPGTWTPLITREKHEAVVATVAGRSALGSRAPRRRSLLTGLMVCGICGRPMYRSTTGKTSDPHSRRVWRCNPLPRTGGCGKVTIRALLVEPVVVEATMQVMDSKTLAQMAKPEQTNDHAKVARELVALDKRLAAAEKSYAAGKIRLTSLEAVTVDVDGQRKVLRDRLARTMNGNTLAPFVGVGVLRRMWPTLSDDQRRTIIGESLGTITIKPAGNGDRVIIGATRRPSA
jgi:site-specific DNA recombinase